VACRAIAAKPDLAGRQVFEATVGMQSGQRAVEVQCILRREVAAHQPGK